MDEDEQDDDPLRADGDGLPDYAAFGMPPAHCEARRSGRRAETPA